jgi:hypothetical protein
VWAPRWTRSTCESVTHVEQTFLGKAGGRPLVPILGCWHILIAWLTLALSGARSPTDSSWRIGLVVGQVSGSESA